MKLFFENENSRFWTPYAALGSCLPTIAAVYVPFFVSFGPDNSEGVTMFKSCNLPGKCLLFIGVALAVIASLPISIAALAITMPIALLHDAIVGLGQCFFGEENQASLKA